MTAFNFLVSQPPDLLSLVLESERLRLVPISEEFAQDIFHEFNHEITPYMIPQPAQNIEETRQFINKSRNAMKAGYNFQSAILSKETNEYLGNCGLHGHKNIKTPELGIWLKKSAHGNGYGREAIATMVNWAQKNIEIDYFIYPVDRRNVPSCKIPESLNGEIISEIQETSLSGHVLDVVIYKIGSV